MTTGREIQYPPVKKQKFFYGYVIVIAAVVILIASQSTRYSFGVFFKPVLSDFGWTRAMTSGAFSLCMMMEGVWSIIMGGLTDRLGPRKILTLSGFLIGLGLVLVSRINSLWQFYLFYGLIVGTGMGGIVIPLMPTIARWFVKKRATVVSIVLSGVGLGALVGPLLADLLISRYEWRTAFLVIGVLIFVVVAGAAQFLRHDPARMGLAPYGQKDDSVRYLRITEEGKSLKEALSTAGFWTLMSISFCLGFFNHAVAVHLVPKAIDQGIPATTAASILSLAGIMMTIGRLAIGSSADIFGIKRVYIICTSLVTVSLAWLWLADEQWKLYLFAIVFGLFEGGASPLMAPAMAGIYGVKLLGLLTGFCGLAMTAGAAAGPTLSGYLFDITGNYQMAFLICTGVSFLAVVSTLFLPSVVNRTDRDKDNNLTK